SEKTKSSRNYDRYISCNATRAKSQELKYFRFPEDEESRFNQYALENYFSQVRRMTILLQWTSCTRTRMLLAELMFAMCRNANYEPDDDIILESTQIIPQTDEDGLDLVVDEPSWIAQKHRKIGIIWSSTVPLMWQATFQKYLFRKSTVNSANQIYASNAATATYILLSFKEFANSKAGLQYPSQLFVNRICKSGEIFNYIFSNTSHQRGILKRLIANLREIQNSFLTCSEHSTELWELKINSYARTMLSKIISKKQSNF
ncbi:hypothetical protein AVEN_236610-1, partial [Araneus ventricosus]